MKALKRLVSFVITAGLIGAVQSTSAPTVTQESPRSIAAKPAASSGSCWNYKKTERGFARKMNLARSNNGKVKLSLDPQLSRVARKHTREMVKRNTLYHTPSSTLSRRVTRWNVLGENVGVGGTVDSLHEAFMNSPSHRDNILYSSYRHVGVGVMKAHDRMWVTVVFEAKTDPGTTLWMPSC